MKIEHIGNVAVVAVKADFYQNRYWDASVLSVIKTTNKVVFDMRHVNFIDSAGCGVLLTYLKAFIRSGGDLKLCRVHKPVLTLFELLRVIHIIDIFNTCDEAVRSFES